MKTLAFINPLKPGKLDDYKKFSATNLGLKQKNYIDLLNRYGLKNVKVYYHKLGDQELITVIHDAEDDAMARLANFPAPDSPYDKWFMEQLNDLHPMTQDNQAQLLFELDGGGE